MKRSLNSDDCVSKCNPVNIFFLVAVINVKNIGIQVYNKSMRNNLSCDMLRYITTQKRTKKHHTRHENGFTEIYSNEVVLVYRNTWFQQKNYTTYVSHEYATTENMY